MFVFAVATPALLVVVLGYAVGYAAGAWVTDLLGTGWTITEAARHLRSSGVPAVLPLAVAAAGEV